MTTGSLAEYIEKNPLDDKKVLFFMPHGYGPCRQGQYFILLNDTIRKLKLKNVGVLSMDDEASFDDLGQNFFIRGWIAIVIADLVHDIESVIMTLAADRDWALEFLNNEWNKIIRKLEKGDRNEIYDELESFADNIMEIKLKHPLDEAKVISLIGEIYVRQRRIFTG